MQARLQIRPTAIFYNYPLIQVIKGLDIRIYIKYDYNFNPFFGKGEIMLDENGNSHSDSYKSPLRKLVNYFKKSRNQWKAKCQEAKYQVKLLKNKIRYVDQRKEDLKRRVKELEKEICLLNAREKQLEQEINKLKKI
jgi:hypothetical protein